VSAFAVHASRPRPGEAAHWGTAADQKATTKQASRPACTQCSYRQAVADRSPEGPILCRNAPQLEQSLSATRFSLSDLDGQQPAGTYSVETVDTMLDDLSFIAYRRVSTAIMISAIGVAARQRQTIVIDALELEAALKRDAERQSGAKTPTG
jgi:hypothetical protein